MASGSGVEHRVVPPTATQNTEDLGSAETRVPHGGGRLAAQSGWIRMREKLRRRLQGIGSFRRPRPPKRSVRFRPGNEPALAGGRDAQGGARGNGGRELKG